MEFLSVHEIKKRQHEKEIKSLRNRMGANIVWFDSLSKTKQYDILFEWKRIKNSNKRTKPEYVKKSIRVPLDPNRPWGRTKLSKVWVLEYPPSFKHFIKKCQTSMRYQVKKQNVREIAINILLNNEK